MEPQRAAQEPTVRTFETDVVAVDGDVVRLDETHFYAESGGQPADRGSIDDRAVTAVRRTDDGTEHVLADASGLEAGTTVECAIDDEFRTYCMRAHTASHVLYGAARGEWEDLGYGGFDIAPPTPEGSGKVRIDFRTSTDVDDDVLVALERRANRVIWEDREVSWETVPVDSIRDRDDVAFNETTEEGAFGGDLVRVVTIESWDVAACGGTHVASTIEVGPITVLERSNPGAGLTRVEFAVGPVGLDRRAAEKRAAYGTATELGTSIEDLRDAAAETVTARESALDEQSRLRNALIEQGLAGMETVDRDGDEWIVARADELVPEAVDVPEPNELEAPVREVAGDVAGTVAVVGKENPPFVVVASTEVDAAAVVDRLTEAFGGGGGGSEAFAQAGGLDASAADVQRRMRRGDDGESGT